MISKRASRPQTNSERNAGVGREIWTKKQQRQRTENGRRNSRDSSPLRTTRRRGSLNLRRGKARRGELGPLRLAALVCVGVGGNDHITWAFRWSLRSKPCGSLESHRRVKMLLLRLLNARLHLSFCTIGFFSCPTMPSSVGPSVRPCVHLPPSARRRRRPPRRPLSDSAGKRRSGMNRTTSTATSTTTTSWRRKRHRSPWVACPISHLVIGRRHPR